MLYLSYRRRRSKVTWHKCVCVLTCAYSEFPVFTHATHGVHCVELFDPADRLVELDNDQTQPASSFITKLLCALGNVCSPQVLHQRHGWVVLVAHYSRIKINQRCLVLGDCHFISSSFSFYHLSTCYLDRDILNERHYLTFSFWFILFIICSFFFKNRLIVEDSYPCK